MRVRYAERAVKDLRALARQDARRILRKIAAFAGAPDPFSRAAPLTGPLKGLHRFRIGSYRAIVQIDNEEPSITVLTIRHRREAYR